MKKLSGLIALLLCVIIGGVYANWTYAQSADITDQKTEILFALDGVKQSGVNGEYTIESNVRFKVYQKEGSDHVAELRVETTDGSATPMVTVKFTPTAAASVDIKENGVATEIAFTFSGLLNEGTNYLYKMDNEGNYSATGNGVKILTFKNETNGTFEENVTWQKKMVEGSTDKVEYFYVTFDATQLLQEVNLSQEFVLDTFEEYRAFENAVGATGSIILKVTDGESIL